MSTFETIYIIGHTIGSFLFAKKVYHFVIDDYEEFKQWQATKRQKGEGKND